MYPELKCEIIFALTFTNIFYFWRTLLVFNKLIINGDKQSSFENVLLAQFSF